MPSREGHIAPGGEVRGVTWAVAASGRAPDYLFGQSDEEAERLRLQARMFAPYTARFLEDAGISPGMKVLDVGTGAGDVALLAAGLVGQQGTVVGIDFNAELIETARARAAAAGCEHVSFVVRDAASVELDRGFDAVVGRCVLFFAGLRPRRRHCGVPRAR
jgi:2-polyprenyl-3-methyl-5-hydroxy-6-metoxy-1,4-benzoquinol methylase